MKDTAWRELEQHFPKKEKTLIQARIPKGLAEEARLELDKKNLSWTDFLIACINTFIKGKK